MLQRSWCARVLLMNLFAANDVLFALVPFFVVGAIVLGVIVVAWVLYTVVWMGVRRGLEEYYGPGEYRGFTPPPGQPSGGSDSSRS
jgi:hypothetical protein